MDMFEEARSLAVMMKMRSMSQSEAAKMLGVSQSYVANKLRLLKLSDDIQKIITEQGLTERHARAILRLKDKKSQSEALDKICERRLSVEATEALIDLLVMSEAPSTLGKGKGLGAIDIFLDSIKRSLDTLKEYGAGTSSKISYENERIHISIFIDENGGF